MSKNRWFRNARSALGGPAKLKIGRSFLPCGHSLHGPCYDSYIEHNIACPLCRKSVCNPDKFEAFFDEQFAEYVMPDEYKDKLIRIQCNDCLAKSNVPFHIFGGKCKECRSYNTSRIGEELLEENKTSATNRQ